MIYKISNKETNEQSSFSHVVWSVNSREILSRSEMKCSFTEVCLLFKLRFLSLLFLLHKSQQLGSFEEKEKI